MKLKVVDAILKYNPEFGHWKRGAQEKGKPLRLMKGAVKVMAQYGNVPLTVRQILYRLMGIGEAVKEDYQSLSRALKLGRIDGIVDWDAIRDDGIRIETPSPYRDPQQFIDTLRYHVDNYELDRQAGQKHRLIVCCEAAGMVPQLWNVTEEYGIEVRSSGGSHSWTEKWEMAKAIYNLGEPVKVLYFGDYDPSGQSMFEVLRTHVKECFDALNEYFSTNRPTPKFFQIAVTLDQIDQLQLPWATKETKDTKAPDWPDAIFKRTEKSKKTGRDIHVYEVQTVELEAIDPNDLPGIVREAITAPYRLDLDVYQQVLDQEEVDKAMLREALANVRLRPRL